MTKTYPRVLHVGFNPIGSPTNTGLTLGSMFDGWPRQQLLQVYTASRQEYVAGEEVIIAPSSTAPLDGMARRLFGSRLPASMTDGLDGSGKRPGATPFRTRVLLEATMLNDLGPVWPRGGWIEHLRTWRPDVIHSLLGGVRITRLVLALSRRLDVPVVPHFMDDWLTTCFADGEMRGLARREVDRLVGAVMERSPLCITIGQDMRDEYIERLGRECRIVGNSVDFDAYESLRRPFRGDDAVRRIRYVGGLHLGRVDVVRAVGRGLADLPTSGRPWRLQLSVPKADLAAADELAQELTTIEAAPTLAPAEVPMALVDSDALLFVESSDATFARFTRLSVSTKVPEYLAAQRPVLVAGPAGQASVRALLRSGCAHYVGSGEATAKIRRGFDWLEETTDINCADGTISAETRDEFGARPTQERLRLALLRADGAA